MGTGSVVAPAASHSALRVPEAGHAHTPLDFLFSVSQWAQQADAQADAEARAQGGGSSGWSPTGGSDGGAGSEEVCETSSEYSHAQASFRQIWSAATATA